MDGLRGYRCSLCNISCNSSEQLRCHKSSKAHLKRCKNTKTDTKSESFECYQPWQMSPKADSPGPLACHSLISDLPSQLFEDPFEFDDPSASTFASFTFTNDPPMNSKKSSNGEKSDCFCSICGIALHSQANFEVHVKGRQHLDKLRQKAVNQAQVCVCNN